VCALIAADDEVARLGRAGRETVEQSGNIELFADEVARHCQRLAVSH